MIEDKELCALFLAESEEHLQSLDEGLLRLEANPRDTATLEQVFRNAHSLKGAARMLGVGPVEIISHHFEDALGGAARGHTVLSSEVIDRLYRGLDAIRKLVDEAVTGNASSVDVENVLAQLSGEAPAESEIPTDVVPELTPETTTSTAVVTEAKESQTSPAEVGNAHSNEPMASLMAPVDKSSSVTNGVVIHHSDKPSGEPTIKLQVELRSSQTQDSPPVAPSPASPTPDTNVSGAIVADRVVETQLAETAVTPNQLKTSATDIQKSTPAPDGITQQTTPANFKIETIRVEPTKLDALMTLAGELTVTTTRVTRGLSEFDALLTLWEEWNKDAAAAQRALTSLSHSDRQGTANERANRKLVSFHDSEQERLEQLGTLIQRLRQTTYEDVTRLNFVADELEESIRNIRLLPLATIFNLFPRMVRDLARAQAKEVQLIIEGGETTADKRILEELKDPLMHMIRNAIDHGLEPAAEREKNGKPRASTLRLKGYQTATNVVIELIDDGRGLDVEAIKHSALKARLHSEAELAAMPAEQIQLLIFSPGFSTSALVTDVSGRGVGLDVVRANVELLRGSIQVQSSPGLGCRFRIQLPITLATTRVLLVTADARTYALPVESVQRASLISRREIFSIEGRATICLDGQPLSVVPLSQLLEIRRASDQPTSQFALQDSKSKIDMVPCVILSIGEEHLGLLVDAVVDEQEVMLKPLGAMLKRVRNVSGATILGTGEVCMVLNPHDLIKSVQRSPVAPAAEKPAQEVERRKLILLAEDSITTRTQEKRILEGAGYEVVTAVDGLDAFNKLGTRPFDAVVTDVEMPNMTGLGLAEKIRQDAKYRELPIILVTSLASDEDKHRGVEVGANAYITKGTFEQKVLLETLSRLV